MSAALGLALAPGLAVCAFLGVLLARYARHHRDFRLVEPARRSSVALISPCKGSGPSLVPNARRLLEQDYPAYGVSFVVESEADPAFAPLRELVSGHPHGRVLVAGRTERRSQKVHNLLHGVRSTTEELLVFVDNDMIVSDSSWLRRITALLEGPDVFITTSFFRLSDAPGGPVFELADQMVRAFEWSLATMKGWFFGGSFALRRAAFEEQRIESFWDRAIAEDISLVPWIRRQRLRVVYVPDCISGCRSVSGLKGYWMWMRRQFYGHRHWGAQYAVSLLGLGSATALALGGPVLLVGFPKGSPFFALGAAALVLVLFGTLLVQLLMTYPTRFGTRRRLSPYGWLAPVNVLLIFAAGVASLVRSRFVWANIRYTIRGFARVEKVEFL